MSHTVTHWTWVCVGLCLLTQSVLPHRALLGWCPSCWEQQPPCPFRRAPPPSSADRHTCSSLCSDNDDSEQSGMQHVWQWNPKQTAEYLTKYTLSSTVARGTYQLISCFFFPNATVIHEYDSQSLFLTQNNNRHNGRVFFTFEAQLYTTVDAQCVRNVPYCTFIAVPLC